MHQADACNPTRINMICPLQTKETDILLDYTAGRLDAPDRAFLERHMENCQDCGSFRMEQTAVWDALDLWASEPVSTGFNRDLWRRIDAAAAQPWYKNLTGSPGFAHWKRVLPLTAAIAVVAFGFLLDHPNLDRPSQDRRTPNITQAGFTVTEAEQVEQTLDDIQLLHQLDSIPADSSKKM